jgi:hypothetical protein
VQLSDAGHCGELSSIENQGGATAALPYGSVSDRTISSGHALAVALPGSMLAECSFY